VDSGKLKAILLAELAAAWLSDVPTTTLDYNPTLNLNLVGDSHEARVASLIEACRIQHDWLALVAALFGYDLGLDEATWRTWAIHLYGW